MPTWVLAVFVLAGILFLLKLFYVLAAGCTLPVTSGALFVTTPFIKIRTFLNALPMKGSDVLFDLGCGDGRVLRAARRWYGVKAVGFEINPLAYLLARMLSMGDKRVRISLENFWLKDMAEATVVFCYLFPDVMEKLAKKLEGELRPGSRVVSCNFPLPGWHPEKTIRPISSCHGDPIFLYRFPDACSTSTPL